MSLYELVDARGGRPTVNGRPLPPGVTLGDWLRLHFSPGLYAWLNDLRGARGPLHQWSGV